MKQIAFLLSLCLLTSCSYNQFGGVAAGSSLGALFGSSIGGLMGGPRGSDKGTLAGMVIGGAIGAAATAPRSQKSSTAVDDDVYTSPSNGVRYGSYKGDNYSSPTAARSEVADLTVENIYFLDENNNHRLDQGEQAYIVFDIYNESNKTLYNIAPNVTCSSKRVVVSPAATVQSIAPGKGVRYKAAIRASRSITSTLTFTISFGYGAQKVVAKTFTL